MEEAQLSPSDLETLKCQSRMAETLALLAHNQNSELQESIRLAKQRLDSTKLLAEKWEQEKETAYLQSKQAVSELGSSMSQLHQQCCSLNAATCPKEPRLMRQMPLDDLQTARKRFENDLKLLIIRQTQKESQENGQDGPASRLKHLVTRQDKKVLEQQCRDLEKLQSEHSKSLAHKLLLEARNKSLRTILDNFSAYKEDEPSKNVSEGDVKIMEQKVKAAAVNSVKKQATLITMANTCAKRVTLQNTLEKMSVVNRMLARQNAIDKLICNMLSVESEITQEASHFLSNLATHFKQEHANLTENHKLMDELKNSQVSQTDVLPKDKIFEEDPLSKEFYEKSLNSLQQHYQQIKLLQMRSELQKKTGDVSDETSNHEILNTTVNQLEKLMADFKTDVHNANVEYKKTEERQKMCQDMKPPVDLWQVFLTQPESLTPFLPKSD